MFRRWAMTMLTGLALSGAYAAYSVLIAPAVRLPVRPAQPEFSESAGISHRPAEHVRVAGQWLKDHAWAAEAKKLLRTDEMFIFTNDWTPRGEQGQIRFRPFAAVWLSVDKHGSEQAITISAESALLKFEHSFDIDNPQPGRITGGSLDGEVRITGPDGLEIAGENFFFAEGTRSIFSNSNNQTPITFKFGENRGQALGLTVLLIKPQTPVAKDRPNIVGVESIMLRKNVKMELKLDDDPTAMPIIVKCSDNFQYLVEQRTATFDKNVLAYRRDAKSPTKTDRLLCDRLTLQFDPKAALDAASPAVSPNKKRNGEYQQIERQLQFRSLKAEGQRVGIAFDQQSLKAVMTSLTYEAATRTVEMTAPQAVKVEQQHNQLQCPRIRLVLGADNSLAEVLCLGMGWLENYDQETGELAFAADWVKQLRKSTDPETQLDLIELEQDASFRQAGRETALGANLIRLWFTPMNNSVSEGASLRLGSNGRDADPKRLLALKNVALVSPQMEAETEELEVVFEADAASPGNRDKSLSGGSRPSRRLRTGKPGLASIPPESTATRVDEPTEATEDAPRPPMIVSAEKIRVRMRPLQQESETADVAEIWTSGHVRIEQPTENDGEPLVVTGERMHVENESALRQIVHVYGESGRPAHIRDERQQLHIEGQLIHLDRGENLAWVEGGGLLQLPVTQTLDGQTLPEAQLLDVWWKERMDFDGLLATFEGDVRAKLAAGKMQCQSMQVALTQKVSFSENANAAGRPEVQSVTCRDGVEFENHRYQDGQLAEIQKAKVWEFQFDHGTQLTQAQGPGWMQMWRRGEGKMKGLAVTDSVQANRVSHEPAPGWNYTRVDFAGQMSGQLDKRTTTFQERVEVVYGPVQRPVDVFDQHHLPKDGGFMKCDKLEVAQVQSQGEGKIQLLGAGNTRLEGRGFLGRADFISYDETKGQFVLRSMGTRKATIWREKSGGDVHAQRMVYVPATNNLQISQATGGEGSQ